MIMGIEALNSTRIRMVVEMNMLRVLYKLVQEKVTTLVPEIFPEKHHLHPLTLSPRK